MSGQKSIDELLKDLEVPDDEQENEEVTSAGNQDDEPEGDPPADDEKPEGDPPADEPKAGEPDGSEPEEKKATRSKRTPRPAAAAATKAVAKTGADEDEYAGLSAQTRAEMRLGRARVSVR